MHLRWLCLTRTKATDGNISAQITIPKNIGFMASSIIAGSNPAVLLFFLSKFVLLLIHSASLFQKALNVFRVDRCWPCKSARRLSWGEPINRASFTATKCELALNRAGVNVTKVTFKPSFCAYGFCWDFTTCYCCSGYAIPSQIHMRLCCSSVFKATKEVELLFHSDSLNCSTTQWNERRSHPFSWILKLINIIGCVKKTRGAGYQNWFVPLKHGDLQATASYQQKDIFPCVDLFFLFFFFARRHPSSGNAKLCELRSFWTIWTICYVGCWWTHLVGSTCFVAH